MNCAQMVRTTVKAVKCHSCLTYAVPALAAGSACSREKINRDMDHRVAKTKRSSLIPCPAVFTDASVTRVGERCGVCVCVVVVAGRGGEGGPGGRTLHQLTVRNNSSFKFNNSSIKFIL